MESNDLAESFTRLLEAMQETLCSYETNRALLVEADYTYFWDGASPEPGGNQVTTYLQLFYHHYEWLVSSATINYAYSDFSLPKDNLTSFRYTIGARLNRNFTVVATYAIGDIQRDLDYAHELSIFATVKF